jgi:hypothetical protein
VTVLQGGGRAVHLLQMSREPPQANAPDNLKGTNWNLERWCVEASHSGAAIAITLGGFSAFTFRLGGSMSTDEGLVGHVPYLRRFARALTGSQVVGDGCVVKALEATLAGAGGDLPARISLYGILQLSHPSDGRPSYLSPWKSSVLTTLP